MPHDLLEQEDIVKKIIYNPCNPITTMFSAVEQLLKFSNITVTSDTQLQEVNIAYFILHRTGKFGLEICKFNRMPKINKTRVQFKQFFYISQRAERDVQSHH